MICGLAQEGVESSIYGIIRMLNTNKNDYTYNSDIDKYGMARNMISNRYQTKTKLTSYIYLIFLTKIIHNLD